jgi:hypothetical protein
MIVNKKVIKPQWKKIVYNLEFPFGTSIRNSEPYIGVVVLQNFVIHTKPQDACLVQNIAVKR